MKTHFGYEVTRLFGTGFITYCRRDESKADVTFDIRDVDCEDCLKSIKSDLKTNKSK